MPGTDASAIDAPATLHRGDSAQGLKCLKRLMPLLAGLHPFGCDRDRAHNRLLHFDQYCALVLLYLFNPLIGSIRALQRTLGLPHVAKVLGIRQFSLGSFSEAPAVFDPQGLQEVIGELATEVRPLATDPRLADLKQALTLADSTMLAALPKLAQAAALGTHYASSRDGKQRYAWRLHTQLDLSLPQPLRIDITGAGKAADNGETQVLRRMLEPDRCYVMDGGYVDYGLFDDIVAKDSSYVCRIRENNVYQVQEERELSQQALDAGIVRDAVVCLGGQNHPSHPVRVLEIKVTPRPLRTRKAPGVKVMGSRVSDRLVIATSLLELPAELVGLIYRKRYSVELFFRFFKGMLGMRHLLSQREAGVQIQTCCAVLACLLISLITGKKASKRLVEMIGWYLLGLASEQDLIDFLNRPDHTGVKKRAKDELWKKLGVL